MGRNISSSGSVGMWFRLPRVCCQSNFLTMPGLSLTCPYSLWRCKRGLANGKIRMCQITDNESKGPGFGDTREQSSGSYSDKRPSPDALDCEKVVHPSRASTKPDVISRLCRVADQGTECERVPRWREGGTPKTDQTIGLSRK